MCFGLYGWRELFGKLCRFYAVVQLNIVTAVLNRSLLRG
jgi:hypothetical protein